MGNDIQCDVAIILVTFNSSKYIRKCIESIKTCLAGIDYSFSIVIVDNASNDDTRKILADIETNDPSMRVILLEENIGFGSANNAGFAAVSANFYVLLNSDAWLIADSISPVIGAMKLNPNIAVCGLPLVFPDGSPQTYAYKPSSWYRWLLISLGIRALAARLVSVKALVPVLKLLPYGREFVTSQRRQKFSFQQIKADEYSGDLRNADWVCGAAMILSGNFIRESGGFDGAIFLYGEDEDLCMEAHRRGREVVVADVPPVVHVFGWGANRFNRQVSDLKYVSLRYFIEKNIQSRFERIMMKLVLPFYVYGLGRWYMALYARKT